MRYLLDTNILSELIKKRPKTEFVYRIKSEPSEYLCTSCICVFELRLGSALRDNSVDFWNSINSTIVSRVNILDFCEEEACLAGDIFAQLKKSGNIIGLEDVFIAATALTNNCVLVTANTKHYSRIENLKMENWLD